jgi:predicted DNA-binding transcriptional regulator AlpA
MNLLTVQQVSKKLNVAVSFVWRLHEKDPTFPKPVRLGNPEGPRRSRITRWVEPQIDDWITGKQGGTDEDRPTGGDVHQAPVEAIPA